VPIFSVMHGEPATYGAIPVQPDQAIPWRAAAAGLCASLVGIGLARFGYMQLIPSLISQHWFAPGAAAYLGAANLAGYLFGALLAVRMASLIPTRDVLRAMMALAAISFFACAVPLSFSWFFVWRFAAGFAGGALMVLAAPSVLPHVPVGRRGVVSGAIFMGVGLGIIVSASLVPLLLRVGLVEAWCGLGAATLVLTALSWNGWPRHDIEDGAVTPRRPATATLRLKALYVQYALSAVGLVPHMMFLVDFVARGLGRGVDVGAQYLVLFGLGATIGPIIGGHIADRIGFRATLLTTFVLQAIAVALLALSDHWTALLVSSLAVGATTPGVVPLALGRVRDLVPGDAQGQQAAWSIATITFSAGQAAGAYGFAFLLGSEGSYAMLFALGAVPFVLALAIEVVTGQLRWQSTTH
jgi:predicted MFS family arabinose efflux permease